jgi:hypothetical protein
MYQVNSATVNQFLEFADRHRWFNMQQAHDTTGGKLDIPAAVKSAFEAPIQFPPLSSAILDTDRVAMAVCENTPGLEEILIAIADQIQPIVVNGEFVAVIPESLFDKLTDADNAESERNLWESVKLKKHIADSSSTLAYLGPDDTGEPISANRDLVESDFVLPVLLVNNAIESVNVQFARQFANLALSAPASRFGKLSNKQQKQVVAFENALGVFFGVLVLVSPQGEILEIHAGSWENLHAIAEAFVEEHWKIYTSQAEVLAGTIEHVSSGDSLAAINAAILNANRICPNGEIVLFDFVGLQSNDVARTDLYDSPIELELNKKAKLITSRRRVSCYSSESEGGLWDELGFSSSYELSELTNWMSRFKSVAYVRDIHLVEKK